MAYPPLIEHALKQMDAVDLPATTKAPPLHRAAWRMGWLIPPPLLAGFGTNMAVMGVFFGVGWGVLMFLWMWFISDRSPAYIAAVMSVMSVLAGLLFGGIMAAVLRYKARALGLPSWREVRERAG